MIYSVHNPVTGLFDYYEGGTDTPINDDLPTPQLRGLAIGVAASVAGRPLPASSRKVGSGVLPVGSVSSGKPGAWRGTQKTGIPSGLGESFIPWPDREIKQAGMVTLASLAVGAAGCAAVAEGDRARIGFGVVSAVLAAWPIAYAIKLVVQRTRSEGALENQQRLLEV